VKRPISRLAGYLLIVLTLLVVGFESRLVRSEEVDPAASTAPTASSGGSRSRERQVSFPTAVPRTAPVVAQPPNSTEEPEDTSPEALPPYQAELKRLAEILGAVHYLRALCGADEGETWRAQMEALLEAEEPGPIWRAQLIEEFNLGYRTFERSYRRCTASAVLATQRYMDEGAELTLATQNTYAN
jgi:uncharacterized protein (TIGR02301 family)